MPALLRRRRRRPHRPVAGLARRTAHRGRHPLHQQHRRRHQLRAPRAGPPDARVRPGRGSRAGTCECGWHRTGEALKTLDGQQRKLDAEMLVIADEARAQALAGVMGGADSEVSAATRTIAIESAWFLPTSVRRTSKTLGLSTEASYRFERGADFAAPPEGLARACALLEQIGAGTVRRGWIDASRDARAPRLVRLELARIAQVLGAAVPVDGYPPDPDGPRLPRRRARRRPLGGVRAVVAERRGARCGPDRRGRPPLRLRPSADDVPGADDRAGQAGAAAGSGPRRPPPGRGRRLQRVRHVLVHRREGGAGVCAGDRAGADRQPAVGDLRGAAAVAAAGPGRFAQPQPASRTPRRPAVRAGHALPRERGRASRAGARLARRERPRALERRRRVRRTSSTSRASPKRLARRSASSSRRRRQRARTWCRAARRSSRPRRRMARRASSASSASCCRRSPSRATFPCRTRSTSPSSISTSSPIWSTLLDIRATRPLPRFPSIVARPVDSGRRHLARRASFVARFDPQRRRRSHASPSSIATRARAFRMDR